MRSAREYKDLDGPPAPAALKGSPRKLARTEAAKSASSGYRELEGPPSTARRGCARFCVWMAVVLVLLTMVRSVLDGRIPTPLPNVAEEVLVIRPAGSAEAAAEAAAFADAPGESYPALHSTPVMGFNTWNAFGCDISEDLILTIADAIVQTGLRDVGYTYIGIDDCWQADERGADGALQAHPLRFPRGIKALADEMHAAGLHLGLYSDYGVRTCAGYPGSYGHYEQDAATFAAWGVDLLKFDRCAPTVDQDRHPARYFRQMGAALRATGRPIIYSLCNWGRSDESEGPPWEWAPAFAHMWRTTTDIFPWYGRVYAILQANAPLAPFATRGAFNDPDMLEVGVEGPFLNVPGLPRTSLTESESALHFSMWAMLAAPLLIGADVRSSPSWVLDILGNPEVIAISQDSLGRQAVRALDEEDGMFLPLPLLEVAALVLPMLREFIGSVRMCLGSCRKVQVWIKPLANHSAAVALLNLGDQLSDSRSSFGPETIEVAADVLMEAGVQLGTTPYCVRDVVRRRDAEVVPEGGAVRREVAPHSHELLVIRPCAPPPNALPLFSS